MDSVRIYLIEEVMIKWQNRGAGGLRPCRVEAFLSFYIQLWSLTLLKCVTLKQIYIFIEFLTARLSFKH